MKPLTTREMKRLTPKEKRAFSTGVLFAKRQIKELNFLQQIKFLFSK